MIAIPSCLIFSLAIRHRIDGREVDNRRLSNSNPIDISILAGGPPLSVCSRHLPVTNIMPAGLALQT